MEFENGLIIVFSFTETDDRLCIIDSQQPIHKGQDGFGAKCHM